MKKTQKVMIMISVLLAPIFVFLFLKEYGTNKFELPVYYPEGNPIAECEGSNEQHKLTNEFLVTNSINLPSLFYLLAQDQNEYYSDLNNVLAKYPSVDIWAPLIEGSQVAQKGIQSFTLGSEEYYKFVNCVLVLGEDHWMNEPITNKYVLIDVLGRIRGFYKCDNLDDIERLDVELDILLNFSVK